MARKQQNFFGPSLGESLMQTPTTTGLTRYASNQPLSPRKKLLFEEADIQNMAVDAQAVKTAFALTKQGELHQHGALLAGDTFNAIFDVKDRVTHRDAQEMMEEFVNRQASMYGRQYFGMLDVGVTAIAREVNRSLYVELPEPEPRKGLLQRIFGG